MNMFPELPEGIRAELSTNRAVVEEIAENCHDDPQSTIFEIGPGIRTLTRSLPQGMLKWRQ